MVGVVFALSVVLSGSFGVLEGNKHTSKGILLGDIAQKYEATCSKKKKEQALAQRVEEFAACYEDMNSIFMDQEERLTNKNMKKLTRFYQNLPEKQQEEVQGKYEQVKKDVQYFKDIQTEEACCNLFNDAIPFSISEQGRKER